ncbi:hypothetical protein N4G70_13390 [Streptomyces sp. ASQP_92]|uniref:hypothetical protein n=1 Tax=Streptomyces sp. ASQP_92 TaxID=2979116 RepID=UPI0021BEA75F|nr:hypothetical protein [Streptomyces sp. ASQP_92]MCT9089856.1 hypothetical protein [Streptomyces sp. ASQP_92]
MNTVAVQDSPSAAPVADDVFDLVIGDLEQELPQDAPTRAAQGSTCIRVYCIVE